MQKQSDIIVIRLEVHNWLADLTMISNTIDKSSIYLKDIIGAKLQEILPLYSCIVMAFK